MECHQRTMLHHASSESVYLAQGSLSREDRARHSSQQKGKKVGMITAPHACLWSIKNKGEITVVAY